MFEKKRAAAIGIVALGIAAYPLLGYVYCDPQTEGAADYLCSTTGHGQLQVGTCYTGPGGTLWQCTDGYWMSS
jgi:hypothetical protein